MKILFAGDFAPRFRVEAMLEKGNYSCFEEIGHIILSSDYSIVNLESPIVIGNAKPIVKSGPNLRTSEMALTCLKEVGCNCVTLANNHFRDYGQKGVDETILSCIKHDIDFVGGGRNLDESRKPLIKDLKGRLVAILNVCESEWSIANEEHGGAAPLNPIHNYNAIRDVRKVADFVLVIIHGGIEHYQYPTPRMVETYRFLIDAGADAIINHHQHCYSGYEIYKGKPIFYGLGNFCFDNSHTNPTKWNEGYMVMLDLRIGEDPLFNLIPYIQCAEQPKVIMANENQTASFNNSINEINSVIASHALLKRQFELYVQSVKNDRLSKLEPSSNKYIRAFQRRKVLPSFISKATQKSLFNMIKCESHREVLLSIFETIYK